MGRPRGSRFFLQPDPAVFPALRRVSEWAAGPDGIAAAVDAFLRMADCDLVAQALAEGCVVVTHGIPAPSAKKIEIPDAWLGLGIKCVTS